MPAGPERHRSQTPGPFIWTSTAWCPQAGAASMCSCSQASVAVHRAGSSHAQGGRRPSASSTRTPAGRQSPQYRAHSLSCSRGGRDVPAVHHDGGREQGVLAVDELLDRVLALDAAGDGLLDDRVRVFALVVVALDLPVGASRSLAGVPAGDVPAVHHRGRGLATSFSMKSLPWTRQVTDSSMVNSRMLARCLSSSSTVRVDKFFRLRFGWTRYRDCPGRRLRMSRSYRAADVALI